MAAGPWSWLEIAKLLVSASIPIAVAAFAFFLNQISKKFEHRQWRSQKLIEKRLAIYDSLTPRLNDLLCYFTYVGCWRELDPPEVIALKRIVDKQVYLAAPLFSASFFKSTTKFMNLCFGTFNAWGADARLKTKFERRKEHHPKGWSNEWEQCFSPDETSQEAIKAAYREVMLSLARDIGVESEETMPAMSRSPVDIR